MQQRIIMNKNTEIIEKEIIENKIEDEQIINNEQPKLKKHERATVMIEKAKSIVEAADVQSQSCQDLLQSDLSDYARAKEELKSGGLNDSVDLLNKLGCSINQDEHAEDEVIFESGTGLESVNVVDVKRSTIGSMFFALLTGISSFLGLVYYASREKGLELDIASVSKEESIASILSWFSGHLESDSIYLGAVVLGLITIVIIMIAYMIKAALKSLTNVSIAKKELAKAESYIEHKHSCKLEMDKVDIHMKDAIKTLKTYEIVLNEQKGKLQRIFHIEGDKEDDVEYHAKSSLEIRETKEMVDKIREFLAVSMSEDGKLSSKSTLFLTEVKSYLDEALEKRYS
jgi:hypothetical protein